MFRAFFESLEAELSKKGLVALASSSSLSSKGFRGAGFCFITGSEKQRELKEVRSSPEKSKFEISLDFFI